MESILSNDTKIELNSFEDMYDIICPKDYTLEEFTQIVNDVIKASRSSNETFHLLLKAGFEFSRTTPYQVKHVTFVPIEDFRVTLITIPLRHIEIDLEFSGHLLTLKVSLYSIEDVDRIYEALRHSVLTMGNLSLCDLATEYKSILLNLGIIAEIVLDEG